MKQWGVTDLKMSQNYLLIKANWRHHLVIWRRKTILGYELEQSSFFVFHYCRRRRFLNSIFIYCYQARRNVFKATGAICQNPLAFKTTGASI